ncbi:MAG: citrate (Si)-synthase [Nitrospirae bacterium]|nr:MAG: citrate (Si)-synthase [Nitrospirota bacterium]
MQQECDVKNIGLRGIKVADTKISFIDGKNGILIYRGYRIEELVEKSTYEETAFLLLKNRLPTYKELEEFKKKLSSYAALPIYIVDSMKLWPKEMRPMQALMASVALIGEPEYRDYESLEDQEDIAIGLIAVLPTAVAAWDRIRRGLEPIEPSDSLSYAENFLYQLTGEIPDKEIARYFDQCLILHAEHSFNASTFACREVVSTRAALYAGVLAGIAALSGPLHGGANEEVMKMLLDVKEEEDVEKWVRDRIEHGEKIMGMGHAVYKTEDPRAKFLKNIAIRLGSKKNEMIWYELLQRIERTATEIFTAKGKADIKPNVDFYSAPVYYLMGIPIDLFTPVFAISRVAGWCAHMLEEIFALAQPKPSLYRPSADYVGHYCGLFGCEYKELNQR